MNKISINYVQVHDTTVLQKIETFIKNRTELQYDLIFYYLMICHFYLYFYRSYQPPHAKIRKMQLTP